jgi:MULE transposase domain
MFDEALPEDSEDFDNDPNFNSVRYRAKRFRSLFFPPLPQSIDDVDIQGEWTKSWSGRQFLRYQANDWGLVVFSSSKMIRILQQCACLFIDGTFETAHAPYEQIVTIHGLYQGSVIPFVFCLVTGKTTGQYRQIFQYLKRAVLIKTGQALLPQRFVLDFENSLMTAIETEFPGCRVSGCYFHWCQSLWRNVQHHHLAGHYSRDPELKKAIRKVMSIAFLPVLLVRVNFTIFRRSRRVNRLTAQYPDFDEWLKYVQQTYIDNNCRFPPPVWEGVV